MKPKRLYNVVRKEFKYLVRWDEATENVLTIHAETETAAQMKIEAMATIAKFEIIERIDDNNDKSEQH